jgi:hypothetical protein
VCFFLKETIAKNVKNLVTQENFQKLRKLESKVAKEMFNLAEDKHTTSVNKKRASDLHWTLTVFIPMLRNITVEFVDNLEDLVKMIRLLSQSCEARHRITR